MRFSSFPCHLWQDFECWLLHVWFWEFSWSRNVTLCHKPSSNQSMAWPDSSSVFWLFSVLLYQLVASLKFLSTSSTTLSVPLEGAGCPESEYKLYLQKFLKEVSIKVVNRQKVWNCWLSCLLQDPSESTQPCHLPSKQAHSFLQYISGVHWLLAYVSNQVLWSNILSLHSLSLSIPL